MYWDYLLKLNDDEREELKHAELLDNLDAMSCQSHGEHAHWRREALEKIHDNHYGNVVNCRYCRDNRLKELDEAFKLPALQRRNPESLPAVSKPVDVEAIPGGTGWDKLPESVKNRLLLMGIRPDQVKVVDGVIYTPKTDG